MKEGVSIKELTGITVSPGNDQLIVLHCPGGNDLVVSLHCDSQEDRIGELLGIVLSRYVQLTNTELPVNVSKTISCSLGGKKKVINIQVSSEVTAPTFKKGTSNTISYLLPPNFAIVENGNGNNYIKC